MDESIEETYFRWLCAKVISPYSDLYYGLLLVLHKTEFVWIVLGDRNRVADGCELRLDFLRETNVLNEKEWYESPCSVLEALIAFAGRANFQTDIPESDWFWRFIENLGLSEYRRISDDEVAAIQAILNTFVYRTYDTDGRGGLFPLVSPKKNQRKVEIWYQFAEYVAEQHLV